MPGSNNSSNSSSNSTQAEDSIWNGLGRPARGQYIAAYIQVIHVSSTIYVVRNLNTFDMVYSLPNGNTSTLGPRNSDRISLRTGLVDRHNYRSGYSDVPQLYTSESALIDAVFPPEPTSLPTPSVSGEIDPRSPWRVPSHVVDTDHVWDELPHCNIVRVPRDKDYIQRHQVRLIALNELNQYYVFYGSIDSIFSWNAVAYSEAYKAYVLAEDMIQGPTAQLTVRRDEFGYYVRPEGMGARVVPVNWVSESPRRWANLDTLQDYYNTNPGSHLTVSAQSVYGLPCDYQGYPIGSQYSGTTGVHGNTGTSTSSTTNRNVNTEETQMTSAEVQKQQKTKELMQQLVDTRSLKQAESLIQCGLEFEFHTLGGKKRGEFGGDLDEGKVKEAVEQYVLSNHGYGTGDLQFDHWLVNNRSWTHPSRRLIYQGLLQSGLTLDVLSPDIRSQIQGDLKAVGDSYLTGIRSSLTSGNARIAFLKDIGIPNWEKISSYTQLGDDGSVQGGEVRTVGPRTIPEFLTAAKVLSEAPFTVDINTSLHIHMSVKEITHAYGERFQAEMYAYLLRNLHRVPDPVRKRMIAEKGCRSYAKLILGTEKYSAIHFHKKYNTWEFRLFGNTNNYIEMRTCLQLAYEALKHAYSVKLGKSTSLLGQVSTAQIQKVLEKMMASPEKFWDTLAVDTKLVIEPGAA